MIFKSCIRQRLLFERILEETILMSDFTRKIKLVACSMLQDLAIFPFLCIFSFVIGAIATISPERVSEILIRIISEGVGIYTIGTLLGTAICCLCISLFFGWDPDSKTIKLLRAPVQACRSVCISTLAVMSGVTIAIWLFENSRTVIDMISVLMWMLFFWMCAVILDLAIRYSKIIFDSNPNHARLIAVGMGCSIALSLIYIS